MARVLNVGRLVTLAKFLAPIKEEKFNIDSWGEHRGDIDKADLKKLGIDKLLKEAGEANVCLTADKLNATCGTTACALGWAASMPEFQKCGLSLEVKVQTSTDWQGEKYAETVDNTVKFRQEGKRTQSDFDAGAHFFGLSNRESEYLFGPMAYADMDDAVQPIHVVAHIIEILFDHGEYEAAAEVMQSKEVKKAGARFTVNAEAR